MIPNQMGDNDSKRPDDTAFSGMEKSLVSWVMDRVKHGRDVRDAQYGDLEAPGYLSHPIV